MIKVRLLAAAQLPNAKGTLYTAPPLTRAIIKHISLVNTDNAAARTVNLYVNNGTSRRIIDRDLSLAANGSYQLAATITLEPGQLLEGDASAATTVDYVVSGAEVI